LKKRFNAVSDDGRVLNYNEDDQNALYIYFISRGRASQKVVVCRYCWAIALYLQGWSEPGVKAKTARKPTGEVV